MAKQTAESVLLWKKIQEHLGISVDGDPGPLTAQAVAKALGLFSATGGSLVPESYYPLLAQIESGGRLYAKSPSSSASGLYQFIKGTWLGLGGKWGPSPQLAFGGLTPSAAEQLQRAKVLTERNAQFLRTKGLAINKATLYAAHFLGATTAVRLLSQPASASAEAVAGEAATKANPSILRGKTVGEFLQWLQRKTGEAAKS